MKPDPAGPLRAVRMFACLAHDERQRIAGHCQMHGYGRDQVIIDALSPQKDVLREHSCVALALLRDLVAVIRQADQRISELSTLSACQRLCRELQRRAAPMAGNERHRIIEAMPTQEALASITGATRETVARLLGQLRGDGLIKRVGGRLLITDAQQLALLADGRSTRARLAVI